MVVLATLVINKLLLNDLNDHQWLNDLNYLMRDDATDNSTLLLCPHPIKITNIINRQLLLLFPYFSIYIGPSSDVTLEDLIRS